MGATLPGEKGQPMELPIALRLALQDRLESIRHERLMSAAQAISLRYRTRGIRAGEPFIHNHEEALAYAATRMPATFVAVCHSLREAMAAADEGFPSSWALLDVGAGTGAATWAAAALLRLRSVICVEQNQAMGSLGEALMRTGETPLQSAEWKYGDIATDPLPYEADLVVASYVMDELDENARKAVAEKLWKATKGILLLVEAGTPNGYRLLRQIRKDLLAQGARVLAPCPHEKPCPLDGQDWCHFVCRLPRERLHRLAKNGEAPYEDEKYAYLALAKASALPGFARILRHPRIGKGHVKLSLCAEDGLRQETFSKKDGEMYKLARKAACGDRIPQER